MKSGKFNVKSMAVAVGVLCCAVVSVRARWIEDGVGAAWGSVPAEAARECVPWDDAARTRATVGTLGLAERVADSNTVVVAGAGLEGVDGTYALSYEDEWSATYLLGEGGAYELQVQKDASPQYARILDTAEWTTRYETVDWPDGAWAVAEGGGVAPAPVAGYLRSDATQEVTRAAALRWEAAHGWGDHAEAGYLAEETDPLSLALDQAAPQEMSGFPKWRNPQQRVGGAYVTNGSMYNRANADIVYLAPQATATVAFWGKTTTTVSATKYWFFVGMQSDDKHLRFYQPSGDAMVLEFWPNGGSGSVTLATPGAINDGAWHLFAASWATNTMGFYLDGELAASAPFDGDGRVGLDSAFTMRFGSATTTGSTSFLGSIDSLSVWTNALAAGEIRDVWRYGMDAASGLAFPSTGRATSQGLLWQYRMDEGTGTGLNDTLGVGRGMGFVNGVMWNASGGAARTGTGAAWNDYLEVLGDLAAGADRSRGVLRVGNAQATTRLSGGLAVEALHAAPASATAAGRPGEVRVAADALYVCVATNSWVRANLAAW